MSRFEYCGIEETHSTSVIACLNILDDVTEADIRSPVELARQLHIKVAEQSVEAGHERPPVEILMYPPTVHMSVSETRGGKGETYHNRNGGGNIVGGEDAARRRYRALPATSTPSRQTHAHTHARSTSPASRTSQPRVHTTAPSQGPAYNLNNKSPGKGHNNSSGSARRALQQRRWDTSDDEDDFDRLSQTPSRAHSVPAWSAQSTPRRPSAQRPASGLAGPTVSGVYLGSSKLHTTWTSGLNSNATNRMSETKYGERKAPATAPRSVSVWAKYLVQMCSANVSTSF
jgi:hypothetical protein